jgi:hypothetical protein
MAETDRALVRSMRALRRKEVAARRRSAYQAQDPERTDLAVRTMAVADAYADAIRSIRNIMGRVRRAAMPQPTVAKPPTVTASRPTSPEPRRPMFAAPRPSPWAYR